MNILTTFHRRKITGAISGAAVLSLLAGAALAINQQAQQMCQQAEQLINARRFPEAIQLLQQAAQADPTAGEPHGYLGMAYQNSANPVQAIAEYTRALELNPQMTFININLGTCYMNSNRMDQAAPHFQRYLQTNPTGPEADQARMLLQQASARGGQQNLRPIVERGQMLLQQQKYAEAQAAFEQAIAMQPTFAPAHFYLGFALASGGNFQKAITHFQEALRLDPSLKEATINIASNYQSLGDIPNAIAWYQKYLQQNPGSPKASDIKQRITALQRQAATMPAGGGGPNGDDYFASIALAGKQAHWTHMPIRVFIDAGNKVPGFQASYNQQLTDAFSMWSQASGGRLTFSLAQSPAEADITCGWTNDARKLIEPGRPVEGGLTKVMGQPQPSGDVAINKVEMTILTNRSGKPLSDPDMKRVCLHEVGHALGMSGHSSNNQDIMFFSEVPTGAPILSPRDVATIRKLYP